MNINRNLIDFIFKSKFQKDTIVNFISVLIVSSCGVLLNILIGKYYNSSYLGIYNKFLAIYFLFSIISLFGLDLSTLKYTAHNSDQDINNIITSSLLLTGLISIIVIIFTVFTAYHSSLISNLLSKKVYIFALILGLPFIALFKLLMGFLNGLRKIIDLSIFYSVKWLLLLTVTVILVLLKLDFDLIIYSIPIIDIIMSLILLIYSKRFFCFKINNLKYWIKCHLSFGFKSMFSSYVDMLNSKIDILMVGFFLSNSQTGIYSLASSIGRGFMMLVGSVQRNFNPIISKLVNNNDIEKLKYYIKKIRNVLFIIVMPTSVIIIIVYIFFIRIIMQRPEYNQSIIPFVILIIGTSFCSIFYWASGLLPMSGRPGKKLLLLSITLITNIIGNIILIPHIDIVGAAIATSLSYFMLIVVLFYQIKKIFSINLLN